MAVICNRGLLLSVLVLALADAAFSPTGGKTLAGLTKDLKELDFFDALAGKGEKGKGKKGSVCGDGVTDLATEECDEGKENGEWPASFCLPNCTFVPEVRCGDFDDGNEIQTAADLEAAQICRTLENIRFDLNEPLDVVMPNLTFITGDDGIRTTFNNMMNSLSMPNLLYVEDISLAGMENFRFLSSPCLIGLTDDLDLFNLPNLTGFNLDALEFIGDDETRFTRLPLLTKLSLPSLFFLGDTIEVDEMTSLEEIDLPKLYAVNRAFDISNVPALKVVRMPSLALSGQTSGWDVEGPVPSPSGFTFELCSLPAFEVRYFFNGRICTDGSTTKCTAVGAGSTECASGSKKEKKGGGALAGLFDFSGDTKVLPDGGKIWGKEPNHVLGLSDDKFDGLFGSGAGKQKRGANAEADGCLPVFPADLPEKKQAPVCGNGLVELGEECDGDAAVCDNESCTLKDSPEVVCELDGGTVINSLADFDALRGCAVIILSFSFDPPVAPVLVIGNSMEIPTNFSLPLLQAFYGTLEISNDPGNVVEVLSFPSAWK
eukprot:Cvel_31565.t1-p1 / transcript=Cvel_31565.t1 / gene=Cvel_31565 / organism=Chromera_velia_CCMP2878 / gene_product=Serine/arginine repetitive matrix protein 2, putative / transcript_product=Serine/arginine repetitive matrix protein 2, putative / location=Cvel_scaffold4727:28-4584(-) / protein_length=544 / sequence_SO=supercontig / SO=protein_coding / is_pseudo=false